jgi:type IV secretion system protein VirB8
MRNSVIDGMIAGELPSLASDERKSLTAAFQTLLSDRKSLLQEELIFGASRRERRAGLLVALSLIVAGGGVGLGLWGMSQTETRAYLTIVDKDTGIAERAVTVERAVMDQSEAVVQSLVHGYVMDRETFDPNDNEHRILDVFRRSSDAARTSLQNMWNTNHPSFNAEIHPPNVYGKSAQVIVDVNNVTKIADNTIQVRFTKTLTSPGAPTREAEFTAVVTYVFKPETRNNLELLWENPFGFYVTNYRITAEVVTDE